ncbi:MAG: SMP-30/gluconolactonase/LRE family protein [Deltaproteobacteria bacterium]|nr:SMP-30/gluconolactonase/LRE family protein [Deltaproteobacteria bacterium]
MRQTLALLTLGLSLLTLTGCPKGEPAPRPDAPGEAPAVEAAPAAEKAAAPAGGLRLEGVGFATPESVLHDDAADLYLVSNINGSPLGVDDNGFISRVTPEGKVKELKWIDGAREDVTLNAPKGMAISEGLLYVTDIDHVRRFDLKTGDPRGAFQIVGATFLNDLTVGPDGALYVSDMGMMIGPEGFGPSGTDAIHRIEGPDRHAPLVKSTELNRPNGLCWESETLRVVTFGAKELYAIEEGKKTRVLELPAGRLDGIVATPEGQLLISSWEARTIFAGPAAGPFVPLLEDLQSPADLGYDARRARVLVPLFELDALLIAPLPPGS